MAQSKNHTIKETHPRRKDSTVTGTVEELTEYFSYTLEIGNSHKPSINRNPKTIKSLVSNLNKAFDVKEGACYDRTGITLVVD